MGNLGVFCFRQMQIYVYLNTNECKIDENKEKI